MVSTIFQYGEDALNNEMDVSIVLPSFLLLEGIDGMLSFRATEVRIPPYSVRTFTQNFRGYELERWKPGNEAKELTLSFRIDKYWRMYDLFLEWSKQIVNLEAGTYAPDTEEVGTSRSLVERLKAATRLGLSPSLRGTLIVQQNSAAGDRIGRGWTFFGIWPKSIPEISFDNKSSGDPIDLEITFGFSSYKRGE